LPVIIPLHELSESDLVRIITEPKNALVRQYKKLAESANGSKLEFTTEAIREIACLAKKNETGARALRNIFESFMIDILYYLPEQSAGNYIIDENIVRGLGKLFVKKEAA
jgi:ATP-dependent Clp protease ATP-binding subunit ClpX